MIPHPLTLLYCCLLGYGLSSALGAVLQFVGELCADAVRYGLAGMSAYGLALAALSALASFSGAFFMGFAMRLLAEKSWRRAGGWGALGALLAGAIAGTISLSFRAPVFLLLISAGGFSGAYACDRFRERRELEGAEDLLRSWMFWERGGGQ